ncbi:type I-B CRISPR-associated protein Cas7/Cst2/DevR [Pseudobacter ginsenosidimutans]|uniref:CRISPR-associated Cst2 family autoregulator n=1 Tax=Pseudobacter ginsenosidimutans TaxID=661488 RepID=A0A4Q7MV77_9BACT|nr:type I-B CRISPR-associated protein Cas7/Cst2/DevR [Pseudobacter ginsenosidimutans]QEC40715.1 type I-B CRISPR-associated protein Cas7/Cst2/DevR [Pseudobacter ginsenosidimutans]RZS72567.1 CRISPR-associated Cst2 family autoregulator [Pseudobacter ginsenosidimutans]
MSKLNNITGALLIDATATFLNGAGLGVQEDKNRVIPKTYKEKINNRLEDVPYVSAQAWRRWLRDTTNEENNWNPSELRAVGKGSEKGTTNKISTELNPIEFPEDDLFGYMKAGDKTEESIQRTSPFKSSILKGIKNMRTINIDEAFVHLKEGTPLPYSTKFYSAHLEGFFNLEYYRLGVYDNLGSKQELSSEITKKHGEKFNQISLGGKFSRYELKNAEERRNTHAAGLLRGLAFLRGGAKQAAFGADVAPKVLILAGLLSANPIFNNLFIGTGEKPVLNIDLLIELSIDYKDKLATPIYVGFRKGYLQNEDEINERLKDGFVLASPVEIVNQFNKNHLTNG